MGPAIQGMEMKLGENDEIVVRGPNVFSGYWNRPEQTAEALRGGWFHTGDQGEVNAAGNWRIVGRIKNLIILGSGHKIAPELIETAIAKNLPEAQQVVIVGNGRGYFPRSLPERRSRPRAGRARHGESRIAALQAGARLSYCGRRRSRLKTGC